MGVHFGYYGVHFGYYGVHFGYYGVHFGYYGVQIGYNETYILTVTAINCVLKTETSIKNIETAVQTHRVVYVLHLTLSQHT